MSSPFKSLPMKFYLNRMIFICLANLLVMFPGKFPLNGGGGPGLPPRPPGGSGDSCGRPGIEVGGRGTWGRGGRAPAVNML